MKAQFTVVFGVPQFDNGIWKYFIESLEKMGFEINISFTDVNQNWNQKEFDNNITNNLKDPKVDIHFLVLMYAQNCYPNFENSKITAILHWNDFQPKIKRFKQIGISPIVYLKTDTPYVILSPYLLTRSFLNEASFYRGRSKKQYDVVFLGNKNKDKREWRGEWLAIFEQHLNDFGYSLHCKDHVHISEYVRTMSQSKLSICPRGVAQHTWRIFESLCLGVHPVAMPIDKERLWADPSNVVTFSTTPGKSAEECAKLLVSGQWLEKGNQGYLWFEKHYAKEKIITWVNETIAFILKKYSSL